MHNLLNQSKHDESEPRLALQIRNQEQKRSGRRTERGFSQPCAKIRTRMRKFAPGCENSHQGAKICTRVQNLCHAKCSLSSFVDFLIFFSLFPLLPSLHDGTLP